MSRGYSYNKLLLTMKIVCEWVCKHRDGGGTVDPSDCVLAMPY